jgi:peptidoglycan/LPS O-acetylase OafA/YrhL
LLVYFGTISYSVYLLQWFVWIGWKHVIARIPVFESHPYVMILCASATIIVASSVSYYCFESWARKRIRGIRGLIASTT